jgi:hypothetical protein
VLGVDGARLIDRHRVDEGEPELREAPPDDLPPAERDHEDPAERQERRRLEREDALRRSRIDRDACGAQPAVEQQLDEQTAERMADEDRGLVERADDLYVVLDDLGDPETDERGWIAADLADRPVLARPGRDDAPEALRLEGRDEVVPAGGGHPAAVDEDDGAARRVRHG